MLQQWTGLSRLVRRENMCKGFKGDSYRMNGSKRITIGMSYNEPSNSFVLQFIDKNTGKPLVKSFSASKMAEKVAAKISKELVEKFLSEGHQRSQYRTPISNVIYDKIPRLPSGIKLSKSVRGTSYYQVTCKNKDTGKRITRSWFFSTYGISSLQLALECRHEWLEQPVVYDLKELTWSRARNGKKLPARTSSSSLVTRRKAVVGGDTLIKRVPRSTANAGTSGSTETDSTLNFSLSRSESEEVIDPSPTVRKRNAHLDYD
eukprot:GHVH01009410.1.p1 GENE.GHVH01009410.1~~GHVH01009410.1.p1  ORF type:complete len:261 (+),score=11.76 GHVH01009410.1:88-870(+)